MKREMVFYLINLFALVLLLGFGAFAWEPSVIAFGLFCWAVGRRWDLPMDRDTTSEKEGETK